VDEKKKDEADSV